MSHRKGPPPRRIIIVAPPRVTLQDLTGPYEVFCRAAVHMPGSYLIQTAACGSDTEVTTKFGLKIGCDLRLSQVRLPVDTVVIAGSDAATSGQKDQALLKWLRNAADGSRRIASVCTGAFHLAQAGLLQGRRATTHWRYLELLKSWHPEVRVEPDPIYTQEGNLYTSAGITAGIDLSLALVEEDCGREVAQAVAHELVVFLQRPPDQAQISAALSVRMAESDPIRQLQRWVPDHLDRIQSVQDLAQQANMSVRHFSRVFRRETGSTPAIWLRAMRVEAAQRLLQQGRQATHQVAQTAGYGSTRTLSRSLQGSNGIPPMRYRRRMTSRD